MSLEANIMRLRMLTTRFADALNMKDDCSTNTTNLDESVQKLRGLTEMINRETEDQVSPAFLKMLILMLERINAIGVIFDRACHVLYANTIALKARPGLAGGSCYEVKDRKQSMCKGCQVKAVMRGRQPASYQFTSPATGETYAVVAIPLPFNHMGAMVLAVPKEGDVQSFA